MSLDFTKELENNCYYKAVKQLKEGIQIFNFHLYIYYLSLVCWDLAFALSMASFIAAAADKSLNSLLHDLDYKIEFWKGYSLTLFLELVEEKEPIFDFDIRGGLGGGSLEGGGALVG
ncbi:hypothetical protein NC652_027710 [Populus alba x Populus x berolinensis]|nr:hypothetical protein NC652_027710 [Populus alba x Populus x berolinensis]